MRPSIFAFLIVTFLAGAGCTHIALQRRTVKQASTLTDLQYQQVLDNLAMFSQNPDALAWHVKLKSGTIQIADQGSVGFNSDIAGGLGGEPTRLVPAASALRGVVNQWDVEPASGEDDIELLSLAYQKALRPCDPELDISIRFAIWQLIETYNLPSGSEVLLDILIDAVKDEGKNIGAQLRLCQNESNLLQLAEVRKQVAFAFDGLVDIVNKERLGEPFWSDDQIALFVRELVGNFEKAGQLLDIVIDEGGTHYQQAYLKKIRRRISLITQRESECMLRAVIPKINPFRAGTRKLEASLCASDHGGIVEVGESEKEVATTKRRDPDASPRTYATFLTIGGSEKYVISQVMPKPELRNPGLIDQAEAKVAKLKELLDEKNSLEPWVCFGAKKDVPKSAYYVGRYSGSGVESFVWVMPDQLKKLRDFTLIVLTLAPLKDQDIRGGAAFSPSLR